MPELKLSGKIISERYQIRGRISSGSYAEVFVALDLRNDCEIVVKALNASLQGTPDSDLEQTLSENFEKEAAILKSISHPNIVALLDEGEAIDLNKTQFHFIVLEYLHGGDLLRFTRTQSDGCLSLGQTLNYFRQICDGLSHSHDKGIIHRDLKPNNFLLSADYRTLKVADFGVAKLSSDEAGEITRVGTGLFSAPEHSPTASDATFGKLTASADIYSLAKSCYAIICGRTPSEFSGKPITDLSPAVKRQPFSNALLAILNRATATEVRARYGSISEFWNDLANLATFDPESTRETASKRLTPEEKELFKKRAELTPVEEMLAQRELDLVTIIGELREFELRYLQIVGLLYAELDEIEAEIAEAEAEMSPDNTDAQVRAEAARAQAKESAESTASVEENTHKGKFNPPASLKKLYRELARLLHPDLVLDENEKEKRHNLMAQVNKAYEEGNEEVLADMFEKWQYDPDSVKGEGVGAELIRVIRRIAQAEVRLTAIENEIESHRRSDIYELKSKVEEGELDGRDVLDEMASGVKVQIADAMGRLDVLQGTKVQK